MAENDIQNNPLIDSAQVGGKPKRLTFFLVLILGIFLVAAYIVPSLMDWEEKKAEIISNISKITGRELVIESPIEFSAFPSPGFVVRGIKLKNAAGSISENMIQAESARVELSLFSILFGQIALSGLELDGLIANLESLEGTAPNWNFSAGRTPEEIESAAAIAENYADIGDIRIKSAKIFLYEQAPGQSDAPEKMLPLQDVTIERESVLGPFKVNGTLKSQFGGAEARFTLQTGDLSEDEADLLLGLTTGNSKLEFNGTVDDLQTSPHMSGKINGSVDRSIEALADYFGISQSVLPAAISAILSSGVTEIESNVAMSGDLLEFRELRINSQSTKSSGDFSLRFGEVNDASIQLTFEELDLDHLTESKKAYDAESAQKNLAREGVAVGSNEFDFGGAGFDISDNLKLTIDLKVAHARYKGHEISDFNVKAQLGMGLTAIRELTAKGLPGNTNIEISELIDPESIVAESSTELTKQKSMVSISGDDLAAFFDWLGWSEKLSLKKDLLKKFSLGGEMEFSDSSFKIPVLKIAVSDMTALGQLVVSRDKDGSGKSIFNSALQIDRIDLDKYLENGQASGEADKNKPENYQAIEDERTFDRLRALNLYFRAVGIKFKAKEVIFDQRKYNDVETFLVLQPGIFELKDFKAVTEGAGKISGMVKIDAKTLRPKANVKFVADEFSLGNPAVDRAAMPQWDEGSFSLKRLGVMDGEFYFNIKKLTAGRFSFKDLELDGTIDKEVVNVSKIKGKFSDGHVDAKAVLGILRPTAGASFSLINIDIGKMLGDLIGAGVIKQGKMSVTGAINTSGVNMKNWAENLSGTLSITSRGIVFEGFNIDALAQKIDTFGDIDGLRAFAAKTLSSGRTTLDYMAGNGTISAGAIKFSDLVLSQSSIKSGRLDIIYDIPRWQMNISSKMDINIKPESSVLGAVVPISVDVSGSISAPQTKWDTSGVEKFWERKFFK